MTNKVLIHISKDRDVTSAILRTSKLIRKISNDEYYRCIICTAVSELARNILHYAKSGKLISRIVRKNQQVGIEVVACDNGPGIADVAKALEEHYSEGGTLGLGLPGARRMMDEFQIQTQPGKGTRVTILKWK